MKTNFSTRHLILVCQKVIKVRRFCFTPSRCSALSGPSASVAPWLYVTGVAMHLEIEEYPNTKRDVYYPPNFRSVCEIISGGGACSFNVLVTVRKPP